MLALQVAAGIVLAYVIIVNQRALLRLSGQLATLAAFIIALSAVVWTIVAGASFASTRIPPHALEKALSMLVVAAVFPLAGTGGLGLLMLFAPILRRPPESVVRAIQAPAGAEASESNGSGDRGCTVAFFGLMMLALAVNYALSFPVWALTPVGRWYDQVDVYGRATGWQDGLSILFGAVLWQWPWLPLGLYFLGKRLRRGSEPPLSLG